MKITVICALLATCSIASAGEIADLYNKLDNTERGKGETAKIGEEAPAAKHGITEIGLERGPCFGACPIYSVVIKNDGTLRYNGERFVKRTGQHTAKIGTWQFDSLARFIKSEDYAGLASDYRVPVTDMPTAYTTVVMDGKRKTIRNYGNSGPAKLWAIEQLIDKLMLEAQWDTPDENGAEK